ncbi:GNAT family N-acetyltransferase [Deinococcus sp. Arct2-2]|uniref:GNAT family N-acetyltransferase n=1 Tax=Deinococcus sp. Arct2-2 TaxID=2568653 RepID=UPI0010A49A3C|nr:GNAT family N-acetyltransferase [Deinococcus sp. Arct2-2]THF66781.1 GNAT family N-acetyltransferase [Deinococcus sp. Arct2-2]
MTPPSTLTVKIRDFIDADYPALAAVQQAVWPQQTVTAEYLQHGDQELREHPRQPHFWRIVAEDHSGQIVGAASAVQWPGMFDPHRYHAELMVLPEAEGRGVGRALAEALWAHLQERGAREILAGTQEDRPRGLAFLAHWGFAEAMRFFDNVLDVQTFDPAPFAAAAQLAPGYRAVHLADLCAERGPDAAWAAYFAGFVQARADVPRTGEASPVLESEFRKRGTHPQFWPEAVLLAVHEPTGEVAALTELWLDPADPARLNTGLTGTTRNHRRLGLGLALKLKSIEQARARGAAKIWTGNASSNRPMLNINERLGFVKEPAWIEMQWFAPESEAKQ